MRSHSQSQTSQIKALMALAQARPWLYRWRVTALAAVGYGYILSIGLAFAAAGISIFALLLYGIWQRHPALPTEGEGVMATLTLLTVFILAFGVVAVIIFRAFWVTLPEPKGIKLRRALAPQLFSLLREVGRGVGIGKLRHVTVTTAFDTYIHRQPRCGGLLPPADTLVIGLPVLQALSVTQLRVLLLRELASLACQRRQVGSPWVNWQGLVWQNLSPVLFLFEGMLRWYRPLFNRHVQVMVRQEEFAADEIAARRSDPTILGHVLLLTEMLKRYHHICYQKLLKQAERQPHPPTDGLSHWLKDTVTAPPVEVQERWWHELLSADDPDAHSPSLPNRLTQLGSVSLFWQRFQFGNVTERAADQLLGPYHSQLSQDLNRLWHMGIATDWAKRYDYICTVNGIEQKISTAPLTVDEIWQLAEWHLNEADSHEGRQLLEQCLRLDPQHGAANYTLGKMLLAEGNTHGIPHLEQAMTVNAQWVDPACRLLIEFFAVLGDTSQAQQYAARLQFHHQQVEQAQQERNRLYGRPFSPCPLAEADRQAIRQQLARFKNIETAYLVEKQVRFFPEHPCYMLVVVRRTRWYTLDSSSFDRQLQKRLESALTLPERTVLFVVPKQQTQTIARVDNAQLYSRSHNPHN